MNARDIVMMISLSAPVKKILEEGAERLKLSARGYHKMIKLARTIADLDDKNEIEESHILEAFQYRPKENSF